MVFYCIFYCMDENQKKTYKSLIPENLSPRGINRQVSAAYIGVSPSLFDEMVRDGRMPEPLRINSRVLWDRYLIDQAFEALMEKDRKPHNPWDE